MGRMRIIALLMLATGIGLLAAAVSVGPAGSAVKKAGSAQALRGGTLRLNESNSDFDYVDPQLEYRSDDLEMLRTTMLNLVGYPDKAGSAGAELRPEGAIAYPTVSKDGKTYTFHIRPGQKFSDNSPVTAAAYERAIERTISPKMGSPIGVNLHVQDMIAGGAAFFAGKTQTISGVQAKGQTLTIKLTRPNAAFIAILGMGWFTATKPNMPYDAQGVNVYPAAGPYYIVSRDPGRSTVLKRNPYYHGPRVANPDEITITPKVDPDQSLLQTKAGQVDLDIGYTPPTANASLGKQYGVNKGRFFVGTTTCVQYFSMNNARPPFDNVNLRKAVEYAIDRPAQLRALGAYAGHRTSQILVPGVPGYRPFNVYPLKGADVATAKKIGGAAIASAPPINVIHTTSTSSTNRAQIAEYNLKQVGFKVKDVPTPSTTFYQVVGTKSTTYNIATNGGWCADYFDGYDYLNVLFDGRQIQENNNLGDYAYFNSPAFNKQLDHAASLTGQARANAYAALDKEMMTKYAPVVPWEEPTNDYFVSARVKNWVYSSYYGGPFLNALSVG